MNTDKVREDRQKLGVEKWIQAGCFGTLNYATGVGKTYVAILAIQRIEQTRKPIYVITAPSTPVKLQWEEKLQKVFNKTTLSRIIVESAQTITNRGNIYDDVILIVDESHEFASTERVKIIDGTLIKYKALLCLTASADDKNYKTVKKFAPIVDVITEDEARENGYIEEFIEYNLSLSLTADEQEQYDYHSKVISEELPKFNNNLSLAQFCISGGKDPKSGLYYAAPNWAKGIAVKKGWKEGLDLRFQEHALLNAIWHPNKINGYAFKLMKAVRNRKELLSTCQSKLLATRDLLAKFNKVKTIVFSESTEFADNLYALVKDDQKAVIYHSNLKTVIRASEKTGKPIKVGKTRLKKEAIEAIKNGKARVIVTSKALDKGFDVVDLRMAVTASGTQNSTQYTQRGGRVKRKEVDIFGNTTVLLINLYIKDSQDEKWLKNRQQNITHKVFDVSSLDEIDFKPKANDEYLIDI